MPLHTVILTVDTKAIREFTGQQVFIGKQWHSETNKQIYENVDCFQNYSEENLSSVHCGITSYKLYQKSIDSLEFILFRLHLQFLPLLYLCSIISGFCRRLFLFTEVFHSINTYFIMFFLFLLLYNSLLWFWFILFPDFLRQRSLHG